MPTRVFAYGFSLLFALGVFHPNLALPQVVKEGPSSVSEGDEVPDIATWTMLEGEEPLSANEGTDSELFGGSTPREFFEARATAPELAQCREALAEARAAFVEKKKELQALVKAAKEKGESASEAELEEVDRVEDESVHLRKRMLPLMKQCGECTTAPMKPPQVFSKPGQPKKIWYTADGSCQLPVEAAKLPASFASIGDSLLHLHRYPKAKGGFHNILNFTGMDSETGPLNPDINLVTTNPFFAFIAVRGPKLPALLGGPHYFAYFFKNEYRKDEKELAVSFHTIPGLSEGPEVKDIRASGRTRPLSQFPIRDVKGLWFVNSDGYVRYQTSGNFGKMVPFANQLAEETLLETLIETAERGM
jgi:hypothetical protein